MNLLDLLRTRATEEWLHDLLFEHPRPHTLMSLEDFGRLRAWQAVDAAKGLRVVAEIGDRSNAAPHGLVWEPEW